MLPKGNILLVGAFALPVLCCLIGAGAFVLLVTPPAAGVQGPNPNEVKTPKEIWSVNILCLNRDENLWKIYVQT